MLSWQPPLWTVINSRIRRTLRQLRRPDFRENGSPFSERLSFSSKAVAFLFVRDAVEGPASAAKKLSAFFVSAPVYHQANYATVVTRGKLKCGQHSSSQSRLHLRLAHRRKREPTGPHRADLCRPPAKGALKHRRSVRRGNSRYATPSPASQFRRVMRRGSATDNGRGDEPDAGIGMHHGLVLERAKGIEPSYAAWEAAVLPLNYARGSAP